MVEKRIWSNDKTRWKMLISFEVIDDNDDIFY